MLNIDKLCFNCFHEKEVEGYCTHCGYDNANNTVKFPGSLKEGSILNGQYVIGRVLGQGGFGITYLALDYQLDIKVAIKEYLPDGMAARLPGTTLVSVYEGEKQDNFNYGAERFLDEARVLARFFGNKNIVSVKSYFRENNTAYFVMDYIEGINFKSYIKNHGGKISYQEALRVLVPVINALAVVHQEGVIHRDVTPDNIYITKDNEIKLLDFGSARYSLGDKSKLLDVILKAGYAPKEQYIRKGKQGPFTDIYSLSACFYASITGYLPPEALERMENDELMPISARGIQIPVQMEAAIMKGLALRPEDRFQSMEEFKAVLLSEAQPLPVPNFIPEGVIPNAAPGPMPTPVINPVYSSNPVPIPNQAYGPHPAQDPIPTPVTNPVYSSSPAPIPNQAYGSYPAPGPIPTPVISPVYSSTPVSMPNQTSGPYPAQAAYTGNIQPEAPEGRVMQAIPQDRQYEGIGVSPRKKSGFFQNKRNLVLLPTACVLLLVIAIGAFFVLNRKGDTPVTNTDGGKTASGSNTDLGQPNKILPDEKQNKEKETIILVIDSDLKDFNSQITGFTDSFTEPVDIKQVDSKDEFESATKENYQKNIRSISFGYVSSDMIDDAKANGSAVKESDEVEGVYYIITGIDEKTASAIIDGLKPAEDAVAEKIAADKAAADKAAADKAAADKAAADKAAADKAAADKAAADKAAADKAAADKAAADKAAADKAAADKAAADKAAADKAAAEDDICTYCHGTGKVECTWCDGTGIAKITHLSDDGTEYIYEGNPCPKTITCPICNGTGKKP